MVLSAVMICRHSKFGHKLISFQITILTVLRCAVYVDSFIPSRGRNYRSFSGSSKLNIQGYKFTNIMASAIIWRIITIISYMSSTLEQRTLSHL